MIALDVSALRVILQGEPEAPWFARMMAENDCLIGAPTRLEAMLMAKASGKPGHVAALEAVFRWRNIETVPVMAAHLAAAEHAAAQMAQLQALSTPRALPHPATGSLVDRLGPLKPGGAPKAQALTLSDTTHPASDAPSPLNLGACLAYAVARVAVVPLLFKDDALARTDIVPAWRV